MNTVTAPRRPERTRPSDGPVGSGPRPSRFPRVTDGPGLVRIALHLLLAALPLLAISAHVFGIIKMQYSAGILVIPLAVAIVVMTVLAPHAGDRVVADGLIWGIVACAIYDGFRLFTVHVFHWWADFIPTMGTWITGDPDDITAGAVVGYVWRYIGDGGGIGIAFFAVASTLGLQYRSRRTAVLASVAFAVAPVWAGLVGTVWLAERGQTMMFPLTPTTLTLSLIGHLIFGWILGLGFYRSRSVREAWPWEPITGEFAALAASTGSTPSSHPSHPSLPALPSPRAPQTPPSGQTLDPETFELWQQRLQSTSRGRRTHGAR